MVLYYQSSWLQLTKADAYWAGASPEEARAVVAQYVQHSNEIRLHSVLGYLIPATKLAVQEMGVFSARDQKLEAAREQRRQRRHQQAA